MDGYLGIWANIATVLCFIGIGVWLTILPYTTFFNDD